MARPASYVTLKEFKAFQKEISKGFKQIEKELTAVLKSLNSPKKAKKKAV